MMLTKVTFPYHIWPLLGSYVSVGCPIVISNGVGPGVTGWSTDSYGELGGSYG